MKGGKRDGAGRKPSANPYNVRLTHRVTADQALAIKSLGGAVWLRQQADLENKKPG